MADITQIWQAAQEQVKERLGATVLKPWILPLKIKAQSQDAIFGGARQLFQGLGAEELQRYNTRLLKFFGPGPGKGGIRG